MEAMIKAAENIVGPFLWGNSDILIPPPSFPYGGMENPTLIFATPTILVRYQNHLDMILLSICLSDNI